LQAKVGILAIVVALLAGCMSLQRSDPLNIDVAGVEPLPGEGLELRLAVTVRIQNPNDAPVEYTGAALSLDLNRRNLATGVSAEAGTVPRYGEAVLTIPVTISAFDMARQVLGFAAAERRNEVSYRVRGKLEGGLFGTRRFSSEGTFTLARALSLPPPCARFATREHTGQVVRSGPSASNVALPPTAAVFVASVCSAANRGR
jgi:LEA14-like dessication related protein